MSSLQGRIDEIDEPMQRILHEYRYGVDPAVFALRDEACRLLRPRNLMRRQQISSRYVVVHPSNRYGDGLVPSHVHNLIDSFSGHGFSLQEIGNPLSSEVPPPSNKRYQTIVDFNLKIVHDSMDALPPIAEEEFTIMAVAKSHSSMASRCVLFEVAHDNKKITERGHLSLHMIRQIRPEYADAIEDGFEWDVVIWQAEEQWPALIDLLQETGNLAQAQCMEETRFQVALKMRNDATRMLTLPGMSPDDVWEAVLRKALRGNPKFASELPDLVTYVKGLAGQDGILLNDVISFGRTLKHPRVVPSSVLAALADAPLGEDGHGAIKFRQDVIKAMISASDKYSKEGVETLADANYVRGPLCKRAVQPIVMLADKMKTRAQEALQEQQVEMTREIGVALNLFGIRMVHHVMQRPDPARGSWGSMHEIGYKCAQDIANLTEKKFESPWAAADQSKEKSTKPAPGKPAQGSIFKEISGDGVVSRASLFEHEGLVIGKHVKEWKTKKTYIIEKLVPDDNIELRDVDKGRTVPMDAGTFLKAVKTGDYKLTEAKDVEIKRIDDWSKTSNPMKS